MTPTILPQGRASRLLDDLRPTLRYCSSTEPHVYALAVAASVLLSFYPFLTVVLSFSKHVLRWPAVVEAIYLALNDYLPGDLGKFVRNNQPRGAALHLTSMFLLLLTANGVFEPLEVALNKAWGVHENRTYLKNQLVALGMIFLCGTLALASLMLTALNREWMVAWAGTARLDSWINSVIFKLAAIPISILSLFFIYWLLPNRKISPRRVVPVAILVGLALEGLKYVNLLIWPLVARRLVREYGVFHNSVTILLWSFVAAMVILAGAEWAARHDTAHPVS